VGLEHGLLYKKSCEEKLQRFVESWISYYFDVPLDVTIHVMKKNLRSCAVSVREGVSGSGDYNPPTNRSPRAGKLRTKRSIPELICAIRSLQIEIERLTYHSK